MTRIAYFDCFSGISGDMFIGSLLDAGLSFEALLAELKKVGITEKDLSVSRVSKSHISATKFNVLDEDRQVFRHLKDFTARLEKSALPEDIQNRAKSVFNRLASAEAKIHGLALERVHFHEIGALDTLVDVVGTLAGLRLLGVERVFCSKINVGSGRVKTAHGELPVPAPATAEILRGVPTFATDCQAELVTPTGAALITEIAGAFGVMPEMTVAEIGYGAGTRELAHPNVLRVFIGDEQQEFDADVVAIIETNIDDMNPQLYESVMEKLLATGALDVYLTNILMKKGRPAIKLTVLCEQSHEQKLAAVIFRETSSIGVRFSTARRSKLPRETVIKETEFGSVRFKLSLLDGAVRTMTPEYEDCKRIAAAQNLPLREVYQRLAGAMSLQPEK